MLIKQKFAINYAYDILFTRNIFDLSNTLLSDLLTKGLDDKKAVKVSFVIDEGLSLATSDLLENIKNYIASQDSIVMEVAPLVIAGGEDAKNADAVFQKVLSYVNEAKIDRHSFLIAMGGGAILDMVGFAAAISHRGIRHIRMPSTVLSQNDSGVGVKNGINYFGKKNFLGSFAPPYAVINDLNFLNTLDERDWRSGMSEAVKVALIKDSEFFYWLEANAKALANRDADAMEKLVFDCANLHTDHISNSNDPFELGSSRPLDFGHWAAHKMEQLTNFEVKHGEAVAIGLALDITYAKFAGFLSAETTERILKVLSDLGFDLFNAVLLDESQTKINPELIKGLEEFREHLGGELTITMVEKIGEKFDVHEMNKEWIEAAALSLYERSN